MRCHYTHLLSLRTHTATANVEFTHFLFMFIGVCEIFLLINKNMLRHYGEFSAYNSSPHVFVRRTLSSRWIFHSLFCNNILSLSLSLSRCTHTNKPDGRSTSWQRQFSSQYKILLLSLCMLAACSLSSLSLTLLSLALSQKNNFPSHILPTSFSTTHRLRAAVSLFLTHPSNVKCVVVARSHLANEEKS